jgi:hypothetical protein
MSECHPGKFSKMGGKCPTVILANFQKREENVRLVFLAFWQIFKNGRKLSICHSGNSSKTGVKCLKNLLTIFLKEEENITRMNFDMFSKTGGQCQTVIQAIFQKMYVCLF